MGKGGIDTWQFLSMMGRGFAWLHGTAQSAAIEEAARKAAEPPDPMLGFASGPELDQYRFRDGAFYLGKIHDDHKLQFEAGVSDDRHVFIVAGNRSGKGRSIGIPNVIRWPGPVFAIDPKGEAASVAGIRRGTADAAKGTGTSVRSFVGQKVAILDPLGETVGPARIFKTTYNPLVDIDLSRGGGVRAIRALASSIVLPQEGENAFFSETSETLIAGMIEAVKVKEPPHKQTLSMCRKLLLEGYDTLHAYLTTGASTDAGLATEAARLMEQVGDDEWGSHNSTLSKNLKWLAEPDMRAHLEPSGFSLRHAVQQGWSVFVVIPPLQISDYKAWLRLLVRVALDAKEGMGTNQKGPQTLFLLDEFGSALGHFKLIEEAAGNMAGYGIKLVPIIQNIGQVQKIYQKNWETFLGNAGAILAWGLNDKETEVYLADRLGQIMVRETTVGQSASAGFSAQAGQSTNTGRHQRPVRFPNEIHEQGARETMRGFVIPASGKGFTIRRVNYDASADRQFDHPDFISAWETQFRGGG